MFIPESFELSPSPSLSWDIPPRPLGSPRFVIPPTRWVPNHVDALPSEGSLERAREFWGPD